MRVYDIWLGSNLLATITANSKEEAEDKYLSFLQYNNNIYQNDLINAIDGMLTVEEG